MRRRTLVLVFLAGLVLCAAPVLAQQPVPAPPRVGILTRAAPRPVAVAGFPGCPAGEHRPPVK